MGANNSTQGRKSPPANRPATPVLAPVKVHAGEASREPEKFQYGPPRPQTRPQSSLPPTTRPTSSVAPTVPRTSMPPRMPPPPYSSVDPSIAPAPKMATPCVGSRPPNFQQATNHPVPAKTPASVPATSKSYCILCRVFNDHDTINCPSQESYENNQFQAEGSYQNPPPIPPLPRQNVSDPSKSTSNQRPSKPEATLPIVNTNMQSKKPSPKQTPSPNYATMTHNQYVWTSNMQPSPPLSSSAPTKKATRVIDLNKELPNLCKQIKENPLPSFQHLHAQLKKQTPVCDVRKSMVGDKYLSDVKFIVGDSVFHAHKMIMITASFLFYDHFHLRGESQLKVESIDPETFRKIMSYCYTDKLQVTADDVLELLLAANQLQVRQVTNVCHGFISNIMSADSVFAIFEKALELNNELFKTKCLDYINKNELMCFSSKGFLAMTLPSLLKVLETCQYPQEKVSEIVEKWTNGSMMEMVDTIPAPPNATVPPPPPPQDESSTVKPKGAVKKTKPGKKKKQQPTQPPKKDGPIPPLMSIPLMSQFSYPPPHMQQQQQQQMPPPFPYVFNSTRPFAGPQSFASNSRHPFNAVPPRYNSTRPFAGPQSFDPSNHHPYNSVPNPPRAERVIIVDDDDVNDGIISKDDEAKIKINVRGPRQQLDTEFSRLDFVCNRSMLIHEIWFSENLALKCKDIRVTITILEGSGRNDIHNRTILNNKPDMRINFLRFSRDPLKVYVGQKFFVKLNFKGAAQRLNVTAEGLSSNEMVSLRKDPDVKKYFNCITSLVVSEMPSA